MAITPDKLLTCKSKKESDYSLRFYSFINDHKVKIMGLEEKRTSQRIHFEMPVYIGQEKSVTHDVSSGGIYFLTDHPPVEGGDLSFSLGFDYALPGKPIKLGFQGEVVRIDQYDGKFGIAAKINNLQYIH